MPQPGLMKMRRTCGNQTCLLSDVVSIAFTCFSSSFDPSVKYPIQFFLIDAPQNRFQRFKKPILVSQLSPFQLFLSL
jgi:hypothetical protein